jgi:hypothetical protein
MKRQGRPPISRIEPRFPEQREIADALTIWCLGQPSLRVAAKKLGITYKALSNYRSLQRWIPDGIVKFLGFTPNVARDRLSMAQQLRISNSRVQMLRRNQVIRAAINYARTFQESGRIGKRLTCRESLLEIVGLYQAGQ